MLENFFPKATTVALRRGKQVYADLGSSPLSLFSYRNGATARFFAATATTIFDLSELPIPTEPVENPTEASIVSAGYTGGDWSTAQFATTGGVYLIGVNGKDRGFVFDGDTFYPYLAGGVISLGFDAETVPMIAGRVVTGGTSGASGTINRVVRTSVTAGQLMLTNVTGTFQDDEALTAAGGGSARADGAPVVAVPGLSFTTASLSTADMAYVWVYKNRLFFAQNDSMNAWYITEPDAIGGTADVYPFAGIFAQGGSLLFGAPWSLDSSGDSGLTEQCVFVSTLGEVAVFQGTDPNEASKWAKAGLYRIGAPLGRKAFIRGGGDLAIATTVGLVPLSKAITLDVTALNVATVSHKIADAWSDALVIRNAENWICEVWPEGKMAVVAPPTATSEPVLFVSNTETGAWAKFTNWEALSLEVYLGRLFFGSSDGKVYIANIGGTDDGLPYTGTMVPLFEDLGAPGRYKIGTMGRARVRANVSLLGRLNLHTDFNQTLPPAPDATNVSALNAWGSGVWGSSVWNDTTLNVINQDWQSVGGAGYSISACYRLTSATVAPLDAEIVDVEILYTVAEEVT